MNNTTLVTGIWDLGRDSLGDGWSRSFKHYLDKFDKLLTELKDINLIIFIDKSLEDFVWERRSKENTAIYYHSKNDFSGNFFPFFDKVQQIRTNESWLSKVGWLRDSTQASLEWYNPMVMSKPFLLHNAKIFNPFSSDYLFWVDGGISNTVHLGYFYHDKVLDEITKTLNKLLFICFPYETAYEIHGFDIEKMNEFAKCDVKRVARGGFFGGHKDYISQFNDIYYGLLNETLSSGLMGTEESIFTIISYLYPDICDVEMIQDNGLISTYFENVKNKTTNLQKQYSAKNYIHRNNKTSLYINTFNSPPQLQMLIDSMERYEPKFLNSTDKILVDNSTKEELYSIYDTIASKYDFRVIRKGNLGICRARQLIAEDFYDSKNKFMFFFEDDMLIDLENTKCNFGFSKHIDNLYENLHNIIQIEEYDFLKFSFSEFYGHNGMQWSWHNVPESRRKEYFGDIQQKPFTKFNNIKSYKGIPYADGEVYYSNWPHIITQEGNKKMFLDTTWANPFEQTWMSHFYTLTRNNELKPGILLASPITHNRVYHYEKEERKEN